MTSVKPICANCSGVPRLGLAVVFLMLTALHGFARDEIKVYRVPKEPKLKWNTPAGWTELAPGEMRVASFKVNGTDHQQADVSVIPLPGTAGGDAANVNRWRGQVALPTLPTDALKQTAETVTVGGRAGELYDLSGTNASSGEPSRILAVIHQRESTAWFFKMTGDPQLVGQQKPAFIEFLKSFQFGPGAATAALPPSPPPIASSALPPGHPDISATPPAASEPTREGQPKWEVPKGWQEVAGGEFLVAKFIVSGQGDAKAAVNVSMLAGDGGGLTMNIDRWRQQLGLSPAAGDDLTKTTKAIKLSSGEATWVELAGTDSRTGQPAKMLGVIVPQSGQTWFYKLMGDPKVVADQQEAFKQFVQTATY